MEEDSSGWAPLVEDTLQRDVWRCLLLPVTWLIFGSIIILVNEPLLYLHKEHDSSPPISHNLIGQWMVTPAAAVSSSFDNGCSCLSILFFIFLSYSAQYLTPQQCELLLSLVAGRLCLIICHMMLVASIGTLEVFLQTISVCCSGKKLGGVGLSLIL